MDTDWLIRDADARDLAGIALLYETSGVDAPGTSDPHTLRAHFARLQSLPGARVLVAAAADGGALLGTLTLFVLPLLAHGGTPGALVEDVAVHPDAQGRGLGRTLMAHALRIAGQAGCYKLALSSNAKRADAHAFYERLGFKRHGYSFVVDVQPPAE
ncbi:GNAT family N-acetyltransferase [Azohydromonas lata]|uniref:GNAT family N-acetyltransferase n=1 Tax=Azohydromonas lata TaxID=45677 RepID=A0ABU5IFY1_9BURK|nr:GNAT family N-acetyltransferase [Azohydromonas lata]MDZ5457430.1 GNAT family N-acetyltransferase [Azohydromonas lata]